MLKNIKTKKKIVDLQLGAVREREKDTVAFKKKITNKLLQDLNSGINLGFAIALPLVGGALVGSYLDKKFGTTPKVTLVLIFLGLIIACFYLLKVIRDVLKNNVEM